jgi:CDP-2,3-bis-(O-geranylgeranyl)-sn-glycerol synthase
MRTGWLGGLARPIDGGRTFRGRPLFGRSKTWRGPILVAVGAAAVYALQREVLHGCEPLAAVELADYAELPGWAFGAALGAAAELSELPNSFVKRQLGIAPGATARGPRAALFYVWDQLDLLLGYWLVWAVVLPVTCTRVALSALLVGGIHPLLTVAGYLLGMRPTPR